MSSNMEGAKHASGWYPELSRADVGELSSSSGRYASKSYKGQCAEPQVTSVEIEGTTRGQERSLPVFFGEEVQALLSAQRKGMVVRALTPTHTTTNRREDAITRIITNLGWIIGGGGAGIVAGLLISAFWNLPQNTFLSNPDAILWWIAGGVTCAIVILFLPEEWFRSGLTPENGQRDNA